MQNEIMRVFGDLVEVVGSTLGPDGKNVLLVNAEKSGVTKDGVTVARRMHYTALKEDEVLEVERLNAITKIIVEMSRKTDLTVGDGTTSTIVFAGNLYQRLSSLALQGHNVNDLLDGVKAAVSSVKSIVPKHAYIVKGIKEIERLAYLSSNNDVECAQILTDTFQSIGKSGAIMFNKSDMPKKTEVKIKTGFNFPAGYLAKAFINYAEKKTAEYNKPLFLVTDFTFTQAKELLQVLTVTELSKRPVIIVCEGMDGEAISYIVEGHNKGVFQVAVIQAPFKGPRRQAFFEDLCAFTNSTFISKRENVQFPLVRLEDFGSADGIEVGHRGTMIVGSSAPQEKIDAHVTELTQALKECSDDLELEDLHARLIRFKSGAAEVYIGGATESEVRERRYRLEDALRACNNAFLNGYVAGGGTIYLQIAKELKRRRREVEKSTVFLMGYDAVIDSLDCIIDTLIKNSNISYDRYKVKDIKETVKKKLDKNVGFDFKAKKYREFLNPEVLIIEPAGIAVEVLENSFSIISLLINTKYSV
jgi:chaperonin GroEL